MEKKSRSVESKDFTENTHENPKLNIFLQSMSQSGDVTIYEVLPSTKGKREMGRFYRMEKTFYFREKIVGFYLLNMLLSRNGQSGNENGYRKAIQNILMQAIQRFEQKIIASKGSLEEKQYELWKIKKLKQIFGSELGKRNLALDLEDIEWMVEMMVERWVEGDDREGGKMQSDVKFIYGRELVISQVARQQKITQLILIPIPLSQSDCLQKHLLYKHLQITLISSLVSQIIQTNHQPYIYFNFSTQSPLPPAVPSQKPLIHQLFHNRTSVLQSQGSNTQSDSKSEIVKDQEFYRISSRILSSVRKQSFDQAVLRRQMAKTTKDYQFKSNLMDERMFQFESCLCNSLIPDAVTWQKTTNSGSQMYTRSSSLQKSNFPLKDNLSTSIDLLMRLQLQAQNRRKKSRQPIRPHQNSTQKSAHLIMNNPLLQPRDPKKGDSSQFRINLLNEEYASMFSGSFQLREKAIHKQILGSNKRLLIARSFFRRGSDIKGGT